MSNPWGKMKVGAWAADAEQAEEEEREAAAAAAASATQSSSSETFPSLREAATTKHKKKTKMSLQEFYGSASRQQEIGLTHDEMIRLPTGPKPRSETEAPYGRLGGGFSNYGGPRSTGPPPMVSESDSSSWGNNRRSYGGFEDHNRRGPPSRVSDFDQPPSRADEDDNWAQGKKSLPSFDSGRPNRYSSGSSGGGFGGGGSGLGFSRADQVDNWAANKKPIQQRPSNFGSGFRESRVENDEERPKLVLDRPTTNRPNPFGAARPREEVLAEKGLDWKKIDLEVEVKKTSRPTSSQSSRPGSEQSSRSEMEGGGKPRPKVNPFGDAKPREVLLEEKGVDWRKIDLELEHRGVDRPETEVEKNLKEDIEHMKKELEKESASHDNKGILQGSGEEKMSLHDLIRQKERDLELLTIELDKKVRFGQQSIERPGSGSGRFAGFPERPPSRPGTSGEIRVLSMERPRSRGTGDAWARQGDDRSTFQSGRDRGFLGNRNMDRSRSRERW